MKSKLFMALTLASCGLLPAFAAENVRFGVEIAEGEFYWTNTGSPVYFLAGRTYRFEYFVYDLDNKICCRGEFSVKGATDPASLIDYDFNPVQTEITYFGTPSELENVVVMFTFDEDTYCDFNKFLKLELTDLEGTRINAQFTSKSSLREPKNYGINITAKNLSFDETYILHVPTMFGDGEWFGLTGNDKYLTGRANAPIDLHFNLSKDGVSSVATIESEASGVYYDLSGMPCGSDPEALSPGVYIHNGKKIAVTK